MIKHLKTKSSLRSTVSVLHGQYLFSSPPGRSMDSIPDVIHYFVLPILIPEKDPAFPF